MLSRNELKRLRSLRQKKYRLKLNRFLVEGLKLVEEAVKAGMVDSVFHCSDSLSSDRSTDLMTELKMRGIPIKKIDEKEMEILSDTVKNQRLVALATIPVHHYSQPASLKDNWLYLDNVRDPGNLGSMLRAADWFGLKNITLSPASADPYNPKVVRGGMGAVSYTHLTLPTNREV